MQNSRLVYHLDEAREFQTGVIVGEPMAVWAFGPMAACPLGNSISESHIRQLLTAFRRRTAVILMTAEQFRRPDVCQLVRALDFGLSGQCLKAILPANSGVWQRHELCELVAREAEARNVQLNFAKVE